MKKKYINGFISQINLIVDGSKKYLEEREQKNNDFNTRDLEEIKNLLENGKKVAPQEAIKWAREHHKEGLSFIVKLDNRCYAKWYETTPKIETLEQETLHLTNTNNKMFGDYGGYSCFALSLAEMIRYSRIQNYYTACDRIERSEWEFCIIPNDKKED